MFVVIVSLLAVVYYLAGMVTMYAILDQIVEIVVGGVAQILALGATSTSV